MHIRKGLEDESQLFLSRAKNELILAEIIFRISIEPDIKKEFELKNEVTFFSNVISISVLPQRMPDWTLW